MVLADLSLKSDRTPVVRFVSDTDAAVYQVVPPAVIASTENTTPQFEAIFTEDKSGFYINGKMFRNDSAPMLTVQTGSYQHWRISNQTNEVHPFHIHQVHFLIYAKGGHRLHNPQWMDTVNVPFNGSVDLIMDFTDPIIRGISIFHCHLLNHEDKGMMAKVEFK